MLDPLEGASSGDAGEADDDEATTAVSVRPILGGNDADCPLCVVWELTGNEIRVLVIAHSIHDFLAEAADGDKLGNVNVILDAPGFYRRTEFDSEEIADNGQSYFSFAVIDEVAPVVESKDGGSSLRPDTLDEAELSVNILDAEGRVLIPLREVHYMAGVREAFLQSGQ
ncbi:MAG: hypothetical protein AAF799_12320 [Myxococcota bacterium]